jgi:hypothetical protein
MFVLRVSKSTGCGHIVLSYEILSRSDGAIPLSSQPPVIVGSQTLGVVVLPGEILPNAAPMGLFVGY